jgi:hypothetical protein
MRPLIDHTLELVALGAFLCVLLASVFAERTARQRKVVTWILLGLAALSVGNFYNFKSVQIHDWEQFHFYLGSKYLNEVRYDRIYEAAILAATDDGYLRDRRVTFREPMTFRMYRMPLPKAREVATRGRFTPERWQEFRRDVRSIFHTAYLNDHGNTGSPSWAMAAGLVTRSLPYNRASARVFANLDTLALLILFVTVWRTFGARAMALTMMVGLSVPLVYARLGGSILRMDWLCTLGMSVCFFEKRHFRTAGMLRGYAVSAKVLAGVMVLPFGIRFVVRTIRDRTIDRDHLRYVLFSVMGLGLFVVLSVAYFGDIELWQDYLRRLATTFQENYYYNQHSFRDLFLQAVHRPESVWHPLPEVVASADRSIVIDDVRGRFVAAQIVLLAALGFVAVRNPVRVAFALGPLAVFVVLVTNRYYWQMWMISALILAPTYRKDWRHAAFMVAIVAWLGAAHAVELTSFGPKMGGYFGSYGLFWLGAALLSLELILWYRHRRGAKKARAP